MDEDLPFGGQFNEGATQVKRLINRDRKEFLGNEVDILDKFEKEFGEDVVVSAANKGCRCPGSCMHACMRLN